MVWKDTTGEHCLDTLLVATQRDSGFVKLGMQRAGAKFGERINTRLNYADHNFMNPEPYQQALTSRVHLQRLCEVSCFSQTSALLFNVLCKFGENSCIHVYLSFAVHHINTAHLLSIWCWTVLICLHFSSSLRVSLSCRASGCVPGLCPDM